MDNGRPVSGGPCLRLRNVLINVQQPARAEISSLSVGRPGVIRGGGRHSQPRHLPVSLLQFWLSMVSILKVSAPSATGSFIKGSDWAYSSPLLSPSRQIVLSVSCCIWVSVFNLVDLPDQEIPEEVIHGQMGRDGAADGLLQRLQVLRDPIVPHKGHLDPAACKAHFHLAVAPGVATAWMVSMLTLPLERYRAANTLRRLSSGAGRCTIPAARSSMASAQVMVSRAAAPGFPGTAGSDPPGRPGWRLPEPAPRVLAVLLGKITHQLHTGCSPPQNGRLPLPDGHIGGGAIDRQSDTSCTVRLQNGCVDPGVAHIVLGKGNLLR